MAQKWDEAEGNQDTMEVRPLEIRRILVAVDASAGSLAALDAAAHLAALLGAELLGVFIEDINLLRVSRLPFAREVRYLLATIEPLTEQEVAQRLQLQAIRAELAFARAVEEHRIRGSFHVVQGMVTAELLAAALQADLLVLGRAGRTAVARTGSTARAALAHAACSVMLMQPGIDPTRLVVALYDGSEGGRQALILAGHLAQKGGRLQVLIWAPDEQTARRREREAAAHLRPYKLEVSHRRLLQYEAQSIVHIIHHAGPGMVVVGEKGCRLPGPVLKLLLEELHRPLLVVRSRRDKDTA